MPFSPSVNLQRMAQVSERPAIGPAPAGTIGLGSGDPDFRTPEHVRQAMIDAINAGYSNYPPSGGDPDLVESLAAHMTKRGQTSWTASQVTVTSGGGGALFSSMTAFLNPGDVVLIPEPTFSQYADIARLVGAFPLFIGPGAGWHLDIDAIRAAAHTYRPKMIVLNTPNNPTGILYHREEMEAVAEIAEEYDMLVLSDEAYDHLIYDGFEFVSALDIPQWQDRLLYCNTFSKTWAMTGYRLGWVASPESLVPAIGRISRTTTGGINWPLQRAGFAAVTGSMEPTEIMRREYIERSGLVGELLAGLDGISWEVPQAAFYAFIKYDASISAKTLAGIMRERGVALRSGTEYGPHGEGYVRIAYATDRESLTQGVLRVREVLSEAISGTLKVG